VTSSGGAQSRIPKNPSFTRQRSNLSTTTAAAAAKTTAAAAADSAATCSFQVGDRVCVGGAKAGKVAFIGETKFAPGEWVGIVLDEPQGKNDGTVAGVSYFQCTAMHGVFSRASRLTKEGGGGSKATSSAGKIAPTAAATPRKASSSSRIPTALSPAGSSQALNRTPSPTGSMSSVASSAFTAGNVKVGDRVIVTSQTAGTKTGTLRFLGPTDFAAGEWAGIELDAAIGKNDGTVGEKRYFECRPKFGLFAPAHKVSKSPSNRMRKLSAAPLAQGGTPQGHRLCRQRSDLSEVSAVSGVSRGGGAGTPVSSTTTPVKRISSITAPERLRSAVKEKEQKIEQLMKERHLERQEIAKAASQTEKAEDALDALRKEYLAYKAKSTKQITQLHDQLLESTKDQAALANLLDDERKKAEDLQFRLEEAELRSDDDDEPKAKKAAEEAAEAARAKQEELEKQLDALTFDLEAERTSSLQHQEKLGQLEQELASVRKSSDDTIDRLKEEMTGKVFEAEEHLVEANAELELVKTELETAKANQRKEVEGLKAAAAEAEADLSRKEDAIIELRHKAESAEKARQDTQAAAAAKAEELRALSEEKQQLADQVGRQDSEIKGYLEEIRLQEEKAESTERESSALSAKLKAEVGRLERDLSAKSRDVEELSQQAQSSESDTKQELARKTEEISSLKHKLSEANSKLKETNEEKSGLQSRLREVGDRAVSVEKELRYASTQRDNLEGEVSALKQTYQKSESEVKRLSGSVCNKDLELESLRADLSNLTSQLQELKSVIAASESESQEKLEVVQREHKKAVAELDEKLKKSDATRAKRDDKIQALEGQIKASLSEHQSEAEALKASLAKAETEVATLTQQKSVLLESSTASSKETELALAKARDRGQTLEAEKAGLESQLEGQKKQLADLQLLADKVAPLKAELALAQGAARDSESEASSLRLNLETLKECETSLRKDLASAQSSLEEMRATSSDSSAQIDQMNRDFADVSGELSQVKQLLSEAKGQTKQLTNQLETEGKDHRQRLADLEAEHEAVVGKAANEAKALRGQLDKLSGDHQALKTESKDQLEKLEAEVKQERKLHAEASSSLELKLEALDAATRNLECSRLELTAALKDKSDLEERLDNLKRTHDEEMGELVDVVNDLKAKEEELTMTLDQLDERTSALDKAKREAGRKEQDFQEEIARLKRHAEKQVEAGNRKFEEATKQIDYLKETNSSLRVEFDLKSSKLRQESESRTADLNDDLDRKAAEVEAVKLELEQVKQELEVSAEELENAKDKIEDLQTDLDIKEAGFNNSFKENEETHKEEVEVLITKVEEAKAEVADLHEQISRAKAEHDARIDQMMAGRKAEVHQLQDKMSERDRQILDMKAQCEELRGSLQSSESKLEEEVKLSKARLDKMSGEVEDLRTKRGEIESQLRSVQADYESCSHQNEVLSIKIVEREQHIKEVTTQVESMKVSMERQQREMAERGERATQDLKAIGDLEGRLEGERNRVDEIQAACGELECERDNLKAKVEDFETVKRSLAEHEERESMLLNNIEDLKQKHAFSCAEFDAERAELNDVLARSKHLVEEKLEQFKSQQAKFEQLQAENLHLNSYKRQVLQLEQEKKALEIHASSATLPTTPGGGDAAPTNGGGGGGVQHNEEEMESLKGQVEFLNSVIVDMQRKNDDLRGKYEALESAVGVFDGMGVDTSDMMLLNGVDRKKPAPRLFCDICDQFDLHDTEDCPTQAMAGYDDVTASEAATVASADDVITDNLDSHGHSRMRAKRGEEREYCTTCEVFGHSTENCDESQTF